ncbi:MAG TPA: hypothetical protein VFK34_02760 [Marmoricola sp.]|jgi:hypothetical protein|nr:hypothetical protein [Marmoricola sp.]
MKLYADLPARRARQVAGDVLLVLWLLAWSWLGHAVHDATLQLAEPGHRVESASTSLSERLHETGARVADLPVVGDAVRAPLDDAGAAAGQLAEAGRAQVEAVESLALWLGWSVALVPILVALLAYLPFRVRFVRRASAGRALVDAAADLDLFALRALTHQPLHRLAAISDDPARAWRERDPAVVPRLAALELASVGLRPRDVPRDEDSEWSLGDSNP